RAPPRPPSTAPPRKPMARSPQASSRAAVATARPRASAARRRALRRRRLADHAAGWAFVAPATILIGLFGVVAIGWSFLLSFQQSDLISPTHFVGLDNYCHMLRDPIVRTAVRNTVLYTVVFVPLSVIGGLLVALVLNQDIRGVRFYRTAVFVPVVIS